MLSLIVQVLLSLIRLQQSDQMVQAVCSGVFVHVLCPQCLHTHIISICMARDKQTHYTCVEAVRQMGAHASRKETIFIQCYMVT